MAGYYFSPLTWFQIDSISAAVQLGPAGGVGAPPQWHELPGKSLPWQPQAGRQPGKLDGTFQVNHAYKQRGKMKWLGPRVLLHLRYRLHSCFLPAVILPLGWTGLYRSPAAPWSAITTQAGLSLTKERRGSSNSNQTLRTFFGLFFFFFYLEYLLFRWRVWSHKVHKTILFCIVQCSPQCMVSPTVVLLP